MKNIFSILFTATIIFCISCNTKKSDADPKTVFIDFIKALKRNDLSKAQSLATPASSGTFLILGMGKDKLQKVLEKIDTTKLDTVVPTIEGEKATISYTEKLSNTKANFKLEKINGEWKVAFDLDSILAMADAAGTSTSNIMLDKDSPIQNLDSMEKVLKAQMKGLNIDVDSFEKEMKKMNPKDIDKLIMENLK
jgi:hypothetical protein